MRTTTLGTEGPEVSVVGLGTNNFGSRIDYGQAKAVVDATIDVGINFFDTADIYGNGVSEEFLGRAIGSRRSDVLIATKFGGPLQGDVPDAPDVPRGSRTWVRWAVENSLKRLGTDYIDLYQHHVPDELTPPEETLGALNELVEQGTVRYIGSSNRTPELVEQEDAIARERGWSRYLTVQNHYSLVAREAEDVLLPTLDNLGIGMLPYFPLASGVLTGKVRRGSTPGEGTRLAQSRFAERFLTEESFDRQEELERFADERGLTLLQVAIGGLAAMPSVASVIAGATSPAQVRSNAAAGDWVPTSDDIAALNALR